MKKTSSFWLIGIFLILIPFLGLPSGWKNLLIILIGAWICVDAFVLPRLIHKPTRHRREVSNKSRVAKDSEVVISNEVSNLNSEIREPEPTPHDIQIPKI